MNSMNYIRTCMDYSFLDGKPVKLEVVQTSANNAQNTNQNTNQNVNRNVNSNVVQNSLLRANGNLSLFQKSFQVNNLRQMANSATTEDFFDEEKNNAQWIDLRGNYTLTYLPFNTIQTLEDGEHSITMIFTGEVKNGEDSKEVLCPYTVRFEVYSVGEDTAPVKNIRNARPEGAMYNKSGANAFMSLSSEEATYTGNAIDPEPTVTALDFSDSGITPSVLNKDNYTLAFYKGNDKTNQVEEIKEVGEYVVVATPVENSEWKGEAWATFTVKPKENTEPVYPGGGDYDYGGGGGGYSGPATFRVEVSAKMEHGTVKADKTTAGYCEKVTLTATSDKDYRLDKLTVKDENGKEIKLTENSDGTFSFSMPFGKVTVTATFTSVNPFEDVSEEDYWYDAVLWAYNTVPQVTNGMDDTHFEPETTTTSAHTVAFLWRAAGCPEPETADNPFEDVKESDYFYKAVLWAVENGITRGTDAKHFSPEQTCSTARIITFVYRALGAGEDGWYEEAAAWAEETGLLSDTGLTVSPDEDCPRGAIVTFLYRALATER